MGKISKLFKGELKKIFLGVGIFFMSAFLILTLTISPKFFSPSERQNITTTTTISSMSVKQSYTSFLEEKANSQIAISNIESVYDDLISNNQDFKQNLFEKSQNIFNLRIQLNNYIATGTITQKSNCLNSMIEALDNYKSLYNDYLNAHYIPFILVTEDLDFDISFEIETMEKILNKAGDKSTNDYYIEINSALENYGCAYNLMELTKNINNLIYSNESLSQVISQYKNKNNDYKTQTLSEISVMYNNANANNEYNISYSNIETITDLEYGYLASENSYVKILEDGLYLEVSTKYSDSTLSNYLKFSNFNTYKIQEDFTRNVYLYENNEKDSSYANVFSFNNSSSNTSKTFDYMYFTLELASFLIILFTVVIGANIISKEYSEGTIKLLLIRPFSRNKIILAKLLTTLFFGFMFTLIATVVSLITGCILFQGINLTESVLMIINSTQVIIVPIWLEFLIYLASLFIKIWVYSLLAIAISILFKSNILSVCLSAGIYILNLFVTFIAKGASWLKYNLFASLDLFKYFGGSFQTNNYTNQNLNSLLTSQVFAETSIWLPIIVISAFVIILNILIFTVFKNKDFS